MKRIHLLLLPFALAATSSFSQSLLNKLKDKANQEIIKLEKGTTSPQTSPNKNRLSASVTRNVAVTLGADETFDYQENCIDLGASVNQVSFIVTRRSGNTTQCYAYKNGTRTPVTCPTGETNGCQTTLQCSHSELKELEPNSDELKKYITTETDSHTLQTPAISDQQMKMMSAYMTQAQIDELKKSMTEAQKQNGQTYSTFKSASIAFNDKKYGPYKQIGKFYLTPDSKNFYAIVGESKDANSPQTQNKVITSASEKVITLSDYSAAVLCFASPDNTDFGSVTYGMTGQKLLITTSSGKTFDVSVTGGFEKAWFSATGNHVLYLTQNQLYRDGQVIKTFANDAYPKPCDLFVSSDGQGVTQIKSNTVSFADGDYFEYPLKISIVNIAGKLYYKWLALENREVVIYQK